MGRNVIHQTKILGAHPAHAATPPGDKFALTSLPFISRFERHRVSRQISTNGLVGSNHYSSMSRPHFDWRRTQFT